MIKPINDFSDAKIGDPVTCTILGHGKIKDIDDDGLNCEFEHTNSRGIAETEVYQLNGKEFEEDKYPRLFKGHVEFPDPIPVKKKVKKTEKRWITSYWHSMDKRVAVAGIYRSETMARDALKEGGFVQEIEISAEVEE